jgi:hypothetical protein
VEIERRHARANPAALQSSLEGTLRTYGRVLTALGHEQEALAATREADALLAHLGPSAEPHRPPYTPYGEGASEIVNGVLLNRYRYRYLATVDLAAYGPELADPLTLFESDLALLGEGAEIRRRLADLDPGLHEPEYAQTLRQLGDMLWPAGRRTDSVETMERAGRGDRPPRRRGPAHVRADAHSLSGAARLPDEGHRTACRRAGRTAPETPGLIYDLDWVAGLARQWRSGRTYRPRSRKSPVRATAWPSVVTPSGEARPVMGTLAGVPPDGIHSATGFLMNGCPGSWKP